MAEIVDIVAGILGDIALARCKAASPSSTLRRSMRLVFAAIEGGISTAAAIYNPEYWARFVNDGTAGGSRGNRRPTHYIFFADPRNDPRLRGGYPIRKADFTKLSKAEFRRGIEINRANKKLGLPPHMIVVKSIGPRASSRFYERGIQGTTGLAGAAIEREVNQWVRTDFPELVEEVRL